MDSGIEEAYGQEPDGRLDDRCWVCGEAVAGPVAGVPPNGSETWSAARCADAADDEETAAFLRRVLTGPDRAALGSGGIGGTMLPVLGG
jgi:hypothetical protein